MNRKIKVRKNTEKKAEKFVEDFFSNHKLKNKMNPKEIKNQINQKNFLKNRLLHPKGWSLIGDFSDVQNVFR